MSSYDEHLISMAGGDGDDLTTAIQTATEYVRQREPMSKDLGDVIHRCWYDPDAGPVALKLTDLQALLALVREQAAKLGRVDAACDALTNSDLYIHKTLAEQLRGAINATEASK